MDKTFTIPNDYLLQVYFHKSIVPGLDIVSSRDVFGTATIKCESTFDSAAIGATVGIDGNGYIRIYTGEYIASGDANVTIKQEAKNITIGFSIVH